MSEWLKRLRNFSAEAQNSTRDNPRLEEGGLSRVIAGGIPGESQKKILDGAGQPGPIIKTSSQDFLGENLQSATFKNPQLELSAGLTVWDLLRSDWPLLLETLRDARDTEGSITVYAPDGGGEVQPVRLDRPSQLTATLKALTVKHPDPLEVVIYALKGGRTVLRSRQRRTMIPGRVIA